MIANPARSTRVLQFGGSRFQTFGASRLVLKSWRTEESSRDAAEVGSELF